MSEWTAFDQMASSLSLIAAALWIPLLRSFWRWLNTKGLDWLARIRP